MPRCGKNISYISFISSISLLRTWWTQMSRFMTKQTKWLCAQQRLRSAWASARSDQSLRCALNGYFFHADSEDSDQTGRMPRLIWVFDWRKVHFVGFLMRRLKLMPVSVLHIYQTSFENNLFSIDFSTEHTGSIQIHSTFWIFKMSSAIDSPCSGNKKIVFKIKVGQNLRE